MKKIASASFIHLIVLNFCWCYYVEDCSSEPQITQVTDPVEHGEGPHWDVDTQALYFVDIQRQLVNKYNPLNGLVTHVQLFGGGVSIVIPVEGTEARKLLTTRGHDVVLLNWNHENATFTDPMYESNLTVIASVETSKRQERNRWNDGKADAKGRLWAGTIGPEPIPGHTLPNQAAFYFLNMNSSEATVEVNFVSISNGLVWNKNNTLLYYIDTATYQIDVFDFDLERAAISNRRKVFNLRENNINGAPDGMTIDNKENLWIACYFAGQVINVDPRNGTLLRSVEIPASRVTSLMFGGGNLDILYVTTSRYGQSEQEEREQPLAGSVFAISCLGVKALMPAHKIILD